MTFKGFDESLVPFIVGITGNGRSAAGSKEIIELFPYEYIKPE